MDTSVGPTEREAKDPAKDPFVTVPQSARIDTTSLGAAGKVEIKNTCDREATSGHP
ncbi:hypothetical protein [Actinoallomurus rhizosphaericola]|uniref:hypothetical protein n=1 Tax=Actinoallomurus rhizosphaericola TaxID=2952536 RepID=UPI002092B3EF|nr:hypothetical protein [Actinoallomurus rhizosphaericola]MCO5996199.1 hypothetical protein [Actinoallomurus rhizosphaericola]